MKFKKGKGERNMIQKKTRNALQAVVVVAIAFALIMPAMVIAKDVISLETPPRPDPPEGPDIGGILTLHTFSSVIENTEYPETQYQYRFDWNDGSDISDWTDLTLQGVKAEMNHSFMVIGVFYVKVQAKENAEVSEWSNSHRIEITDNNPTNPTVEVDFPYDIIEVGFGTGTEYEFFITSTDADNHKIKYHVRNHVNGIDFYTDYYDSGEQVNINLTFSHIGESLFPLEVTAIDEYDRESETTRFPLVIVENRIPERPTIDGLLQVAVDTEVTYTVVAQDFDDDNLIYGIDWDDDDVIDTWTDDATEQNEQVDVEHKFTDIGVYTVRVKAKDIFDQESIWSSDLEVTVGAGNPPTKPVVNLEQTSIGVNERLYYDISTTDEDFPEDENSDVFFTMAVIYPDGVYYQADDYYYLQDSYDLDEDGELDTEPDGIYEFPDNTHAIIQASKVGEHKVRLRVRDEGGAISEWTNWFTIDVTNFPIEDVIITGPDEPGIFAPVEYKVEVIDPDSTYFSGRYYFSDDSEQYSFQQQAEDPVEDIVLEHTWTELGEQDLFIQVIWDSGNNHVRKIQYNVTVVNNYEPNPPTVDGDHPYLKVDDFALVEVEGTDDDGNQPLRFRVDWGDGSDYSDWSLPTLETKDEDTGMITPATSPFVHQFTEPGVYEIKAQSRDPLDRISDWDDAETFRLTITDDTDNWPMNTHDVLGTRFANCDTPDSGDILWTKSTISEEGFMPPVIANGNAYFITQKTSEHNVTAYCVNVFTGKTLWTYDFGSDSVGKNVYTPIVVDDKVFFSIDSRIYGFLLTGEKMTKSAYIGAGVHPYYSISDGEYIYSFSKSGTSTNRLKIYNTDLDNPIQIYMSFAKSNLIIVNDLLYFVDESSNIIHLNKHSTDDMQLIEDVLLPIENIYNGQLSSDGEFLYLSYNPEISGLSYEIMMINATTFEIVKQFTIDNDEDTKYFKEIIINDNKAYVYTIELIDPWTSTYEVEISCYDISGDEPELDWTTTYEIINPSNVKQTTYFALSGDNKLYSGSELLGLKCLNINNGQEIWSKDLQLAYTPYTGSKDQIAIAYDMVIVNDDATISCFRENTPPSKPSISGPDTGDVGGEYTFTASSTDPDGDESLEYQFDWGDGEISRWGRSSQDHVWDEARRYIVKVQCQDPLGGVSSWSNEHEIQIGIAAVEIGSIKAFPSSNVNTKLRNIGNLVIPDLDWSISITGGLLRRVDYEISGNIESIDPGEKVTIETADNPVRGFGRVTIEVTAGTSTAEANGFLIGRIILIFGW